jgi:hypothetical protein
MSSAGGILRRHGLTLLLTAALVAVFVASTLPALRERRRLAAERARAEQELGWEQQAIEQRELWIRGAAEDPMVQERLRAARERSPGLTGPHVIVPTVGDEDAPAEDP